MKEAKNKNMTKEEFLEIARTMTDIPRKEKETQRDYYERLKKYGVTRSRFTMQIIEKSLKEANNDPEIAYEIYKEKMRAMNKRDKTTEEKEELPGQIEMELTTEKPDMSEQTKMMRFWGAQFIKIEKALNQINETLKEICKE